MPTLWSASTVSRLSISITLARLLRTVVLVLELPSWVLSLTLMAGLQLSPRIPSFTTVLLAIMLLWMLEYAIPPAGARYHDVVGDSDGGPLLVEGVDPLQIGRKLKIRIGLTDDRVAVDQDVFVVVHRNARGQGADYPL